MRIGLLAKRAIRCFSLLFLVSVVFNSMILGQAQQVCVRAIHPAVSEAHVHIVVAELEKKHVPATPCGKDFQALEVWFYPLSFSYSSGDTTSWVTVNPTADGAAVHVQTSEPVVYTGGSWEMSLHPNGGVWTTQRYQSTSLKSEAGRMGKWIRKHYLIGDRSK